MLSALTPTMLSATSQWPAARPSHAVNITVYHVNPHKYGAIPVNMDTGDATGDLFFDLFEVMMSPLECASGTKTPGHSCSNPEATGKDLMVNKLTLEVDSRYSAYAKCNIGLNGTDGRGHKCADDTYCCFCGDYYPTACKTTLGREDLYDHFGNMGNSSHHRICSVESGVVGCYIENVAKKLTPEEPGYWYSSLASGYCGATDATSCTWRVAAVDKIVTRACHSKTFGSVVQATAGPECLDACGDQKTNTSSPCWTDCFYKAALGPDAGKPGGALAGLPLDQLVAAWEKPFLPEEQGGCPAQQELPSWFDGAPKPAAAVEALAR